MRFISIWWLNEFYRRAISKQTVYGKKNIEKKQTRNKKNFKENYFTPTLGHLGHIVFNHIIS